MTNETETPRPAEPEAAAEIPVAEASPATPRPREAERLTPLLTLAGFVILAGAVAYLWTRPPPQPTLPPIPPDQSGVVAALRNQVASLQSGLDALDTRERADVAALHAAIGNAPSSPSPAPPAPAAGATPAADAGALTALQAQVEALRTAQSAQSAAAQSVPSAASVATLGSRLDALAGKQASETEALRQQLGTLKAALDQLNGETQTLTQSTRALPQLSARSDRMAQLLRAEAALSQGAPLGPIPGAPPALSRFASAAPPTEATLVLAYADAARRAAAAGGPPPSGGFWRRTLLRVEALVTVRQGDRVVVGDPTAGILAHAQRLLVAGDLPGAVAVVKTLQGPAAGIMAPWAAQAEALVDARQALAQMAAG